MAQRADFNGDGYADVAALYKLPNNETALQLFRGSLGGLDLNWRSGPNNYTWENSR